MNDELLAAFAEVCDSPVSTKTLDVLLAACGIAWNELHRFQLDRRDSMRAIQTPDPRNSDCWQ